jgi:hypothetical protein
MDEAMLKWNAATLTVSCYQYVTRVLVRVDFPHSQLEKTVFQEPKQEQMAFDIATPL